MLPEDLQTEERLIRPKEFMYLLGIKQTKFYEILREGKIPRPIDLGHKMKVWPLSQARQVIESIKQGQLSF